MGAELLTAVVGREVCRRQDDVRLLLPELGRVKSKAKGIDTQLSACEFTARAALGLTEPTVLNTDN